MIILADRAFEKINKSTRANLDNKLYHRLVHELVHASDVGDRIVYSREWVSFAQPRIEILQDQLKHLSVSEQYSIGAALLKRFDWPSVYGIVNSLAEYFTSYYLQEMSMDSTFAKKFAPRLTNPSPADRLFNRYYRRADEAEDRHDWKLAIAEYRRASEIDPSAALAYHHMMECYAAVHNYDYALQCADETLACFHRAGVPRSAPNLAWTYLCDVSWGLGAGDENAARRDKSIDRSGSPAIVAHLEAMAYVTNKSG